MQIKFEIDFQLTPRARRAIVTIALPIAVFFGSAATVAIAGGSLRVGKVQPQVVDTSWIDAGLPVSASSLAADLQGLDTRLTVLETLTDTYCGGTLGSYAMPITAGALTGYKAAQSLCSSQCGGAATTHACTADEALRLIELGTIGNFSAPAWIASGGADCAGFTTSTGTGTAGEDIQTAPVVVGIVTNEPCSAVAQILCCK